MSQAKTQVTTVTASGTTGQTCQKTGPYKCSTSPVVIVAVEKGDIFPPGPRTGTPSTQSTTWSLVGPTTTSVPTI
jgi:hypothetical protein